MRRVGTWLQTKKVHVSASTQSLNSLSESQNLEAALRAATLIMNDDLAGAEKGLSQGNSSFHKLGKGIICFLRAALGFEQDIMREASERLADAETTASNDQYKAQRNPAHTFQSDLYAPGSEFALCHAEAQIMGAVVAVLNESLTESIRGFYKLRKAYMTLDGLIEMENKYMKARGAESRGGSRKASFETLKSGNSISSQNIVPGGFGTERTPDLSQTNPPSALRHGETLDEKDDGNSDNGSDDFYDAAEAEDQIPITRKYTGRLEIVAETTSTNGDFARMSLAKRETFESSDDQKSVPVAEKASTANPLNLLTHNPDSDIFSNPLDVFIHSGTNLCFGLLQLLISVIPPVFGKLLYIIGFRGDRERGIRMLWQASKFDNVNGGMAGLILLGWYNGLVGFCDIIPDSNPQITGNNDVEGYPMARLQALLREMRERYPKSQMWLLEEARMAASQRHVDQALAILSNDVKSQLKQLEALHMFEKSLNSMFGHYYQLCSESFIKCLDLNSWSRALYYYISGAAHVAMYRDSKRKGDETESAKQAKLAEEYIKSATTHIGKKKVMGRQLPFDAFVMRKIQKWEARANAWNCRFVDAVGVSPLEEMNFFWNGFKKMNLQQLEASLENLKWSEDAGENPHWSKEDLDERSILVLLRAAVFRNMRRHQEAKALLKQEILCHDAHMFKGHQKDDWTAPTAHYEMAVNLWMERKEYIRQHGRDLHGAAVVEQTADAAAVLGVATMNSTSDEELVGECKEWIEKARTWGSYDLDTRIGMKITTATDAIKKWEAKHGVPGGAAAK